LSIAEHGAAAAGRPPAGQPDDLTTPDEPEAASQAASEAASQAASQAASLSVELLAPLRGALTREDTAAAVGALEDAIGDIRLQNIETRWRFERDLISDLVSFWPPPERLVAAAVAAFRWDEDLRHLPVEHQVAAAEILAIPEAAARYTFLRHEATGWLPALPVDRRPLAAKLLTGRFRPWLFGIIAMDRDTFKAMSALFNELRLIYPRVIDGYLDPRTVMWWAATIDDDTSEVIPLLRSLLAAPATYFATIIVTLWAGDVALPSWVWGLWLLLYLGSVVLYDPARARRALYWCRMLPQGLYRICGVALAGVAANLASSHSPPVSDAWAAIAFIVLMATSGARDFMLFLYTSFGLWFAFAFAMRAGLLPEARIDLVFLGAQFIAFIGVKAWRLGARLRAA
jgi:hypothetical protein